MPGISEKTLRKHFRREIATGAAEIGGIVVSEHLKRVKAGDMIAIEWWEKARMNWRESITVVGGGTEVDPATLSDTEIVERVAKPRRMPAVLRAAKASGTVH